MNTAKLTELSRETPVRYSRLKKMAQSPQHYAHSLIEEHADSYAMRIGRGVHGLVLGTPVHVFKGYDRRSRDWREFLDSVPNQDEAAILTQPEHETCRAMADAVRANRDADAILTGTMEQKINWVENGRSCTGTPDCFNDSCLSDLKTTSCSEPLAFSRHASTMHYPGQLAFYQRGLGRRFSDHFLVAVESRAPYPVTVLRVPERLISIAEEQALEWLARLVQCERGGNWPGYVDGVVEMDYRYSVGSDEMTETWEAA